MSSTLTIARPYARAAFDFARAHESEAEWADGLAFAAEVSAEPEVTVLMGDPRVVPARLATLFLRAGEPRESAFERFVRLLADNRRLRALPEIAALFERFKRDAEHVLKVRVSSAVALDDDEATRLAAALRRRFGSDIEMEQRVDPSILGGAVIDAGEAVIDGSLRGRLVKLGTALTA